MSKIDIPGLIAKELKDSEKDPNKPDKYSEAMKSFSTLPVSEYDFLGDIQTQVDKRTSEEFEKWLKDTAVSQMFHQTVGGSGSATTAVGQYTQSVTTTGSQNVMLPYPGPKKAAKPLTRRISPHNSQGLNPGITQSPTFGGNPFQQQALTSGWDYQTPQKPVLEEMIDVMFTLEEKIEFLKSLGYKLDPNKSLSTVFTPVYHPDMTDDVKYNVYSAFMKEITIKFKNLLLAKPSLKIKF